MKQKRLWYRVDISTRDGARYKRSEGVDEDDARRVAERCREFHKNRGGAVTFLEVMVGQGIVARRELKPKAKEGRK